ncbi:serine racemase isoform X2 [Macadamia integrifolia]|uniref:serine racemase isoform X2 n=1 Tax=Macadamia integrifolia TaxID=60698 RepID=UPI001C4E4959|nr:serine racemase isoform X2 [Macadamia integrifolia]
MLLDVQAQPNRAGITFKGFVFTNLSFWLSFLLLASTESSLTTVSLITIQKLQGSNNTQASLSFSPPQKDTGVALSISMEGKDRLQNENYAADISSIKEAQVRINSFIHRTPVLSSESLNSLAGRKLFFKCECLQKGGAFKFRGACNAIFSLEEHQAAKGIVTHSSGNHAAAVSLAAKLRGIPAYIVIPKNAPNCKVENVRRYGGQVIWSEPTMQSRESVAAKVLEETGAVLIHPFNDGRIISGQGTIALELLEQVPQLDTVIVPISGGGLISGVALAAKAINPAILVLAAEPRGANDAAQSKAAGRIIKLPETNTVADGLRAFMGDLTWPVVRDLVDDIIVVEDNEIIEAMRLCYEILKVAVEPSGAIGLAAVLSEGFRDNPALKDSKDVGIILSGGNVDLSVLWESFRK